MRETEWIVVCARRHRFYMRLRILTWPPCFTDCPKCGAPRRGWRYAD